MRRAFVALAIMAAMTVPAAASDPVLLHAAGSLRAALTEVARPFEGAGGLKVEAKFGPSGVLKDEIAAGARAEVFASANMEHPQALAKAYCTNALLAQHENADQQIVALPDALAVGADYGLTVISNS